MLTNGERIYNKRDDEEKFDLVIPAERGWRRMDSSIPSGNGWLYYCQESPVLVDALATQLVENNALAKILSECRASTCTIRHHQDLGRLPNFKQERRPDHYVYVKSDSGLPSKSALSGGLRLEIIKPHLDQLAYGKIKTALAQIYTRQHEATGQNLDCFDPVWLKPDTRFWLCIDRGKKIIGVLCTWLNRENLVCGCSSLAVDPEYRNQGIATLLVAEAAKRSRGTYGASPVLFYALVEKEDNPASARGFEKLGFKVQPEKIRETHLEVVL